MNLPLFTNVRGLVGSTPPNTSLTPTNTTDPAALRAAASQMEALFVQELFKSMRASTPKDSLFNSEQTQFYQEMLDQQLAVVLAKQGQLGIAAQIVRQMGGATADAEAVTAFSMPHRVPTVANPPMPVVHTAVPQAQGAPSATTAPAPAPSAAPWTPPKTAPEFVKQVWGYAQQAAAELGVSAKVLVAQAAHESAWGRSMPRLSDGRSSFNLFGIKAHGGWTGPVAASRTHEYIHGRRVNLSDGFRAYGSYGESFMDYVAFLRRNGRYAQALKQTDDAAFMRELQRAGYATDPKYASKVMAIARGKALNGG